MTLWFPIFAETIFAHVGSCFTQKIVRFTALAWFGCDIIQYDLYVSPRGYVGHIVLVFTFFYVRSLVRRCDDVFTRDIKGFGDKKNVTKNGGINTLEQTSYNSHK